MTRLILRLGVLLLLLWLLSVTMAVLVRRPADVLLTAVTRDTYHLIDVEANVILSLPLLPDIHDVYVLPDGRHLLIIAGESIQKARFVLWNVETGESFSPPAEFNLASFRWRLDGSVLGISASTVSDMNTVREFEIDLITQDIRAPAEPIFGVNYTLTSPDGRWLLTRSTQVPGRIVSIDQQTGVDYVLDANLPPGVSISTLTWAVDNARIAFDTYTGDRSENRGVYIATPSGDSLRLIAERGILPVIAPTGDYVAFQAWQVRPSTFLVHDLNQPERTPVEIPNTQRIVWSPGGEYIAYLENVQDENLFVQRPDSAGGRLLLADIRSFAFWD